jgi:hypothetical protein
VEQQLLLMTPLFFATGQIPLLVQDQLQDNLNEISDY